MLGTKNAGGTGGGGGGGKGDSDVPESNHSSASNRKHFQEMFHKSNLFHNLM